MAFVKRMWRFYIVIVTSSCCFESPLCKKMMTFEIERRLNNQEDTIPNDFIINGKGEWKKQQKCPQNDCKTEFKTVNYGSAGSCRCACQYAFSTFRMGATASNSSCIENSKLRSDEGCNILFQNEGTLTNSLTVIDTSKSGQKNVVFPGNSKCNSSGVALYWDYGVWKSSHQDIFLLYTPNTWTRYLKWNRITAYSGRIIKQPLTCTSISTSQTSSHCIIFKISGKLSYDLDPPTKAPTSSTRSVGTIKTLKTQLSSTTKQPTTKRFTLSTTTYQSTSKLVTTVQTTTSRQTTHSLHTTHNTVDTSTLPVTDQTITTERHKHSTNKIASTATENIRTEESEMPVTEVTEQSTTETDVVPGKNGARGESSDSDSSNDTLVITAIGAAAAIACVIIICIFLWFVVKRKQNNRNNEAYCSTDMTVITNGTGMNNFSSAPTLKNPIYDNPAYCDPAEKHHPKQLPMLGNPVYDKAIVNNNVNNDNKGHPNVKNPSNEPKRRIDSNHYDNEDDDEAYDNPGYQELVIKTLKGTANNAGYSDSTYDNTYAEPEKPVYEALSVNNGRDSIYQALVHNGQSTETMEPPEYLTLLNENPSPEKQDIPEYLTLVGEETNQNKPEAEDYDYAYVDAQEKRATLKTPSTKGADMSQQDPKVHDNGPPLYDVLEDPNDKGPPVYDVLDGPDAGDDYLI